MKLFFPIVFSCLVAVNTLGQTAPAPAPPGITVSEWKWSTYFGRSNRLSREDSSTITAEDTAAAARRARNRSTDESAGSVIPPSAPDPFVISPKELDGSQSGFMYKVKVENKGEKKIKAISWEYVFLDPVNQSVISRHKFLSKVGINPGQRKEISALTVKRPMQVVSAETANLAPVERVVIMKVDYSDGTSWSAFQNIQQ